MTTDRREHFPHEAEMDVDQPLSIIGLMGRPPYVPLSTPETKEQSLHSSARGGRGLLVLCGGRSGRIGDRLLRGGGSVSLDVKVPEPGKAPSRMTTG
jgi:hypothetical protein